MSWLGRPAGSGGRSPDCLGADPHVPRLMASVPLDEGRGTGPALSAVEALTCHDRTGAETIVAITGHDEMLASAVELMLAIGHTATSPTFAFHDDEPDPQTIRAVAQVAESYVDVRVAAMLLVTAQELEEANVKHLVVCGACQRSRALAPLLRRALLCRDVADSLVVRGSYDEVLVNNIAPIAVLDVCALMLEQAEEDQGLTIDELITGLRSELAGAISDLEELGDLSGDPDRSGWDDEADGDTGSAGGFAAT